MSQEAGMEGQSKGTGLWAVEGLGVLAREGDLILLSGLGNAGLLDRLLDLLTEIADSGGDGLRFVQAVEETLDKEGTWRVSRSGQAGPAVLAFGQVGTGLVVTVSGSAWVEITTEHGTQRIAADQPSLLLRCRVGSPMLTAHGGLGGDQPQSGRTDRFSRLDAGIVRAGGFSYHAGHPAGAAAREPVGTRRYAVAAPAEDGPPGTVEHPAGAVAEPTGEPEPESAGARSAPAAESEGTESETAGLEEIVAEDTGHEAPGPSEARQPFDAVLLMTEQTQEELANERPPLPMRADQQQETGGLSSAPQILGAYCKNGHFDDPDARFCAVCGISMNQQTLVPRSGPRPPLGLLVLDGGDVFQLDSDYVIGREPALDAAVAAGTARPLRIADDSGTVSRVHVKIELDGWRVLVTDLGSANGTRVRLPDQAPDQELASGIPVRLLPGSHVDMGGAGFHYESHRGR